MASLPSLPSGGSIDGAGLGIGASWVSPVDRNARQSAELSLPGNNSQIIADIGRQMREVKVRRSLNAGNLELTCTLVGPGGSEYLPLGLIDQMYAEQRFLNLRYELDGQRAWDGRLVELRHRRVTHPATGVIVAAQVRLRFEGLYRYLTDESADLPSEFTDEDSTATASDVAIRVTEKLPDFISRTTRYIEPTSLNVGPLPESNDQSAHDALVNALSPGGANTEDTDGASMSWYGIFEPDGGLVLRSLERPTPDYVIDLVDQDVDIVWNGENYAWRERVSYTETNGSSQSIDRVESSYSERARILHNGVKREGFTNLSRVPEDGAKQAARTALHNHMDPVGFDGTLTIAPEPGAYWGFVRTVDGGLVPAFAVKPGDAFWVRDAPASSAISSAEPATMQIVSVESTEWDTESGSLSITFDKTALLPAKNADSGLIAETRRHLEAALSHNVLKRWKFDDITDDGSLSTGSDYAMPEGTGSFYLTGRSEAAFTLEVEVDDTGTSTADADVYIGMTVGGESWDKDNKDQAKRFRIRNGLNGGNHTYQVNFSRTLRRGHYDFQLYFRRSVGSYAPINAILVQHA